MKINHRYLLLFFVVLLLALLPLAYFTTRHPTETEAAWFDTAFSYRQKVPLTNASGSTQTDFQVEITVDTATLITAGKMQSDCSDTRITDYNGKLLPYWIEPTTCNTASTLIWTKVPSIPTSGGNVYLYYGNPSAPDASSTTDTFIRDMTSAVAAWPLDDTNTSQSYARVLNPADSLGRDMVINGGFDTDSNWGKVGNWTISNGVAQSSNTSGSDYLTQSSSIIPIVAGKSYSATYTISNYSSGSIRIVVGAGGNGTYRSANGTYTETITGGTTNSILYLAPSSFTGNIDNVIVKQLNIPSSADFDGSELLTDGDMEAADTSAWTPTAGTITKETGSPHGGSQLLRITYATGSDQYAAQNITTTGKTYHATGYAKSNGSRIPRASLYTDIWTGTTSTDWQPFDAVGIAGSTAFAIRGTLTSGDYVEFDDVSVVEIDPLVGKIPTSASGNRPTVNTTSSGHLSKAYSFDGTDDLVNIYSSDLNSVFNPNEGTIVAWAKVSGSGVWTDGDGHRIISLYADADNRIQIGISTSPTNTLGFSYNASGTWNSTTTTFSGTDFFQVVLTWNKSSDEVKAYLNGSQVGSTQTGMSTWSGNLAATVNVIGASNTAGTTSPWSGLINDVRLYDRALTAEEIASLYSGSNDIQAYYTDNYEGHELVRKYDTDVAVGTLATEEVGPGPVAYWKFDEGADNNCSGGSNDICDSTSNGNDGAFGASTATPTWASEDQCISGKCLYFDGSDDIITLPASDSLNPASITISFWLKTNVPDAGDSVHHRIIVNSGSLYGITILNNGDIEWGDFQSETITYDPGDWANTWHHFELVQTSGSNNSHIYMDGALVASGTITRESVPAGAGIIGNRAVEGYSQFYHGYLDEFKIYPYARTAAQVKSDYLAHSGSIGSSAVLGAQDQSFLSDGLVGYWKMDEASLNSCGSNTDACDASGNSNDMAAQADATTVSTSGKFGNSSTYDGTGDYYCTDPDDDGTCEDDNDLDMGAGQDFSYAFWVKRNSGVADAFLLSKGAGATSNPGYAIYLSSGTTPTIALSMTGESSRKFIQSSAISDNNWHHIAGTFDRDGLGSLFVDGILQTTSDISSYNIDISSSSNFTIGAYSTGATAFVGDIDEVRLYNRALSPAEVRQLADWAPGPIGYWKMDEGSGSSAYDSSGHGLNGSITNATYVTGKFGKALHFNGSSSVVTVNDDPLLNPPGAVTIMAWHKGASNNSYIVGKPYTSNTSPYNQYAIWHRNDNKLESTITTETDTAHTYQSNNTVSATEWKHVALTYDGSSQKIYVDGVLDRTESVSGNLEVYATDLLIGKGNGSNWFNGDIDEVKIYNYARTPGQIIQDLNGGHPLGGSPVGSQIAYWSFDEAYGDTAYDTLGNYNGDLGDSDTTCPTTGADCPTFTKSGKVNAALSFDGTNDYIDLTGEGSAFSLDQISTSAWIYRNASATGTESIIDNRDGNNDGWVMRIVDGGSSVVAYCDRNSTSAVGTTDLQTETWYHVACVLDGTTVKTYINGKLEKSENNATTIDESTDAKIGQYSYTTGGIFHGTIDEVKIYSAALTQDEILIDYNAGASVNFGTGAATEKSTLSDGAGNPPIGYWPLDENSGTTTTADKSGNGYTGTLTSITEDSWMPGKFGSSLYFDGTESDYVNAGDIAAGNTKTWTFWVKPTQTGDDQLLLDKYVTTSENREWRIGMGNSNRDIFLTVSSDGTVNEVQKTTSSPITYGEWSHVAVIYNSGAFDVYTNGVLQPDDGDFSTVTSIHNSSTDLWIGNSHVGSNVECQLDEVKIFDYALTPAQIAYEYNRGAPVGWWQLDECQGTVAYDASGNGNDGTITAGDTSGSNDSVGTCNSGAGDEMWDNGTTGKLNSALDFDGTNDYVSITNPDEDDFGTGPMSVSAWVKTTQDDITEGFSTQIVDNKTAGTNNAGFNLNLYSNGRVYFRVANGSAQDSTNHTTSNTVINDGVWHHITGVLKRGGTDYLDLYIDGKLILSETVSAAGWDIDSSENLVIGAYGPTNDDGNFDGLIDDVRLYNYALSESQIKKIMLGGSPTGSSASFGPETGSP